MPTLDYRGPDDELESARGQWNKPLYRVIAFPIIGVIHVFSALGSILLYVGLSTFRVGEPETMPEEYLMFVCLALTVIICPLSYLIAAGIFRVIEKQRRQPPDDA